jgi:hypothetical protein
MIDSPNIPIRSYSLLLREFAELNGREETVSDAAKYFNNGERELIQITQWDNTHCYFTAVLLIHLPISIPKHTDGY